jgi:hypothetical protein
MCFECAIGCNESNFSIALHWIHCIHDHTLELSSPWLLVILGGGGGNSGLTAGRRDIVSMTHGLIEDRDRNLVVAVLVEEELRGP